MITMARFTPEGVQVLDSDGWREPDHGEWVDIGEGNSLQINAEGYFAGLIHGGAAVLLMAMVVLGVVAAAVSL